MDNDESTSELETYYETWLRVLTRLRGCSPADVARWAAPLLADYPELTLHEPAARWVAPALIDTALLGTLGPSSLSRVARDVQLALDNGDPDWAPASDTDVDLAGARVKQALDRHRTAVPAAVAAASMPTSLSGSAALTAGVGVVRRVWPGSTVADPKTGAPFPTYWRIPFGRGGRITVRPAGRVVNAGADLWPDPFGLNVVVYGFEGASAAATADDVFAAVRYALSLSPYLDTPPFRPAAFREAA